MSRLNKRITHLIILTVISVIAMLFVAVRQANAQNNIIAEIKAHLSEKKVLVTDASIESRIPFRISITMRSESTGEIASPDDPIFEQIIHREIANQRQHGAKIDAVKVIIINQQGRLIYASDLPVDEALDAITPSASKIDDETLESAIRTQVPLYSMSIASINIDRDEYGAQMVSIKLSTQDISTANKAISPFMLTLPQVLNQLRKQGAQILGFKVELFDVNNQPLLKYFNNSLPLQDQASWWQAPGMTQDWFPHPVPLSPTSVSQ